MKKKIPTILTAVSGSFSAAFGQNIAINTSGSVASAANILKILQSATAANNHAGTFALNLSTLPMPILYGQQPRNGNQAMSYGNQVALITKRVQEQPKIIETQK